LIRFIPLWIMVLSAALMVAQGATIDVDANGYGFRSIGEAIDAASSGDVIVVTSGTYSGSLDIDKPLILTGVDTGAGRPVVDGEGNGSAVTLRARGVVLEGFSITNAVGGQESGIRVLSSDNLIRENLIFNNGYSGISMLSASNNTVIRNTIYGSGAGLTLSSSDENAIAENELFDNQNEGIRLVSSSGNVLSGNNATRNGASGIALFSSDDNVLRGNLVWNNGAGILVEGSAACVLSMNWLFGNREYNAYDSGINQWDDGLHGNYHSEFRCTDSDKNGICDTGYRIPGGFSIDNLPLIGLSGLLPTGGVRTDLHPSPPLANFHPSAPSSSPIGVPEVTYAMPDTRPLVSAPPALEEPSAYPGAVVSSPSSVNLIDHSMARAIRSSGEPEGRSSSFSAGEARIYSWVQFGPVYEAHDLMWRWYYPDGSLYGESRGRIPEPQSQGLEHWYSPRYWSELEVQGGLAGRHPGEWRVEFYVDGQMMVVERFSIR